MVSEDRGPNGASGKGKFQPAFCVGLVVTLYKVYSTKLINFQLSLVLVCKLKLMNPIGVGMGGGGGGGRGAYAPPPPPNIIEGMAQPPN